ncbi:MAG: 2-isopropylmalate synthase [Spirochaetaceae bacterium]|jgi:2-isopropylmalate synthase|nr:2-isopropylmalate synthase [Spirochaetaceae bacterium]
MEHNEQIRIIDLFDTTLRDGEQAPGCSMNLQEKVKVARRLERLGVSVIEAGFPASSAGDLEAVRTVAGIVRDCTVAGLCRSLEKDIDAAREALSKAASPRLHVFLATSPIHMEYKLKMTPDAVVERAVSAVKYAKRFCADVEFSAEDASRSDPDFVCRVFAAVIDAGATVVNIPDTTGYAMPAEFAGLVRYIREHTPESGRARISMHCHNDLGLAVANSLAAVEAGADQVECTVNGIGERAGNASLEEIVMGMRVRADFLRADTRVDATQIYAASRLVSQVTGVNVPPNKAIVGENAFAHEAGIHQHGVLANRATYEIMTPESIGIPKNRMVLGKHSGRHAFEDRLNELGLYLEGPALDEAFARFKGLADKKKTVSDRDIEALVMDAGSPAVETYKLDRWVVNCGSSLSSTCTIRLLCNDAEYYEQVAVGHGPIDAAFKAVNRIIGKEPELEHYELKAVTGGEDAQGETWVRIAWEGRLWNGRGLSTDVVESSIKAYIAAINNFTRPPPGKAV